MRNYITGMGFHNLKSQEWASVHKNIHTMVPFIENISEDEVKLIRKYRDKKYFKLRKKGKTQKEALYEVYGKPWGNQNDKLWQNLFQ